MDFIFFVPVVLAKEAVAVPLLVAGIFWLLCIAIKRDMPNVVRIWVHIILAWFAVGIVGVWGNMPLWAALLVVTAYHLVGLGISLLMWKQNVRHRLHKFIGLKNDLLLNSKLPADFFETGKSSDHQYRKVFSGFLDDLASNHLIEFEDKDIVRRDPDASFRWDILLGVVASRMTKSQVSTYLEVVMWWPAMLIVFACKNKPVTNVFKWPFTLIAKQIFNGSK